MDEWMDINPFEPLNIYFTIKISIIAYFIHSYCSLKENKSNYFSCETEESIEENIYLSVLPLTYRFAGVE